MLQIVFIAALILSGTTFVWGSCAAREPVNKNLRVDSCQVVDPHEVPRLSDFAKRYPQGFVESYRQEAEKTVEEILRSYRGAMLTEVQGENTLRYFLASLDPEVCSEFSQGDLLDVTVDSACCDGDPNPPCYLGFAEYLTEVNE